MQRRRRLGVAILVFGSRNLLTDTEILSAIAETGAANNQIMRSVRCGRT
jgi:hypothetical protein